MPAEIELKLEDLAKIALGAPQLTNVNISVLHSLIEILLKKLNCQNEKVSLSAYECESLKKILDKSKISPLAFNDENIELVSHKLERLESLEDQINELDNKLNCHLTEIDQMKNVENIEINWKKWDSFGCEDLCTICDPENDLACKLLKNCDFLKKLLRRISSPMVDRMFQLEDKINVLNEEFTKFLQRAETEYLKIELLQTCIEEIEFLRTKINENHAQFLCTMEEVQDMLDAKLDKIHMPALKKYIRDRFNRIDENIVTLQNRKQCPRAAGIIMNGLRCFSCGSNKVCSETGVEPTIMLPDVKIKPDVKANDKSCACPILELKEETARSFDINESLTVGKSKRKQHEKEIEFLQGNNGILYRKG